MSSLIDKIYNTPLGLPLDENGLGDKDVDPATYWCRLVLTGKLVASNKNKQVAERHINDIEKGRFSYIPERGNTVIKFIEKLPDTKTGKPNKMMYFQKFILGSLYNWYTEDDNRRFQMAYISVARKNGKSLLIAGIALYELLFGKNPALSRQIYCTANAKEQARIVWNMIRQQLLKVSEQSNRLKNMTKITDYKSVIENITDNSLIRPLSKDTSSLDGFEPYLGILDEYHEAKDDKMLEVIRSGQTLLKNRLNIIISTAGFHLNGPMYQEYQYLEEVLSGEVEDDRYFAYIAEQDNESEIDDPELWIKSNPLMEHEQSREIILENIQTDITRAQERGETHKIKTKNFNIWQSASSESYLSETDWRDSECKPIDIRERDVYIGVDLSRLHDLSCVGYVYPTDSQYFVTSYGFVGNREGIETKMQKDKIDYLKLESLKQLEQTTNRTGIIDYEQIVNHIIKHILDNNLNVKALCYDPWGASMFLIKLEKRMKELDLHFPLIEVSQSYKEIGPAVKQFRLDLMDERIIHDNNELLNIGVRNAIVKSDNNGNIILDKKKNREKIDSIVAVLNAYTEAMMHEFQVSLDDMILNDEFGF